MANFYALPALSTWGPTNGPSTMNGWSSTSGGAPKGTNTSPGAGDNVFFDANSGPSRGIGIVTNTDGDSSVPEIFQQRPLCLSFSTSGSAQMSFYGVGTGNYDVGTPALPVQLYGPICDLSGVAIFDPGFEIFGTGNCVITGTCQVKSLNFDRSSATYVYTLTTDLNITEGIVVSRGKFAPGAFNIKCKYLIVANSGSVAIDFGSGTWEMSGVDDYGRSFNIGAGVSPGNITTGTATLKFTNTGTSANVDFGGKTVPNVWSAIATTKTLYMSGGGTIGNFKINANTRVTFQASTQYNVASFTADGAGTPITLASNTPGNAWLLGKVGGGVTYVDNCIIRDSQALAAGAFVARTSVDQGNNTFWTFLPGNSKFFNFF